MSISSPSPISDNPPTSPDVASAPPLAVRRSFQLWVASLVIGVLSGLATVLVVLLFRAAVVDRAVADGADPRTAGAVVVAAALAVGLVEIALAGLGYFFATRMRAGRNWARIVLAVLAAIGVLDILVAATSHNHPAMTFAGAVHVLLMLAAVIYAYQPGAAAWFGRRRA